MCHAHRSCEHGETFLHVEVAQVTRRVPARSTAIPNDGQLRMLPGTLNHKRWLHQRMRFVTNHHCKGVVDEVLVKKAQTADLTLGVHRNLDGVSG
jgi:hypothetical protein